MIRKAAQGSNHILSEDVALVDFPAAIQQEVTLMPGRQGGHRTELEKREQSLAASTAKGLAGFSH